MKCKRIAFTTIVSIAAILLAVWGMAAHRPALGSTIYRGAFTSIYKATGKVEAFRQDYGTGRAASAVSTVTDVTAEGDWPMAAANPQRTSWTPEEVRGKLDPIWYRPLDPYINPKTQIIAANGLLYISTARGLYALDAENGDVVWIYPTELPLGHSPTIVGDNLYVGGYDRKIHAFEATPDLASLPTDPQTGYRINHRVLWTFGAEAGFETNPLAVDGTVYVGNRDGYFYALDAATGNLKWRYKTNGPILFSAAYKDGDIFFASNDSHAYALDTSGNLVWKSQKLPGAGFHSYWPVVYQDWAIFAGSNNYTDDTSIGLGAFSNYVERPDLYQGIPYGDLIGPTGTEPGDWFEGTVTIDNSRTTEYFEQPSAQEESSDPTGQNRTVHKPWRRTYFVLNRFTGQEFTFDSDNDGNLEYAPMAWCGTHSGNRYPPVIGGDGVLYQQSNYVSDEYIARGGIAGWKFGTQFISRVDGDGKAVDEPHALSAGGDLVYWVHNGNGDAGSFDITIPYGGSEREWRHFDYNLDSLCPGYNTKYAGVKFGSSNGAYSGGMVPNAFVPYKGKAFMINGNSIIAFSPSAGYSTQLPLVETVEIQDTITPISTEALKQRLTVEVEKILNAEHLRPGYHSTGLADWHLNFSESKPSERHNYLLHYFSNPSETHRVLIRALPYLSSDLQQQTRNHLQQEFANYPPDNLVHIGWDTGAPREIFDTPPEIADKMSSFSATAGFWNSNRESQYRFYGLWKYTQEFGGTGTIFNNIKNKLISPPDDSLLADYPYVHNAWIAGYIGYLELQEMAEGSKDPAVEAELDRLLALRATNFSKDVPSGYPFGDGASTGSYPNTLNISRNFMYLVPELADYLHDNALARVQSAIDEFNEIAPGWFVSKYDTTFLEGILDVLFEYHSMFQAKALILRESREELSKWLDVPGLHVGDLFYIDNLVSALEAPHYLDKTATPTFGNQGTAITYTLSFFGGGNTCTLTDTLPLGVSAPGGFELAGTGVMPTYEGDHHRLTWSDTPPAGQEVSIRYSVVIATGDSLILVNTAKLSEADGKPSTAMATVMSNPYLAYLPLILLER